MRRALFIAASGAGPLAVSAQTFGNDGNLKGYLKSIVDFINGYIIPLIIAAAILSFIWGMFSFFVLGGADEEKRAKGQQLMIWAVVGLVLMLSLQGIVNIFADALGFKGDTIITPKVPTNFGN
jgi:hypothetical protein